MCANGRFCVRKWEVGGMELLIVEPEDNKLRIRKIVEACLLTRRRVTHLDLEFCGISLQINLSGCYILQGMLLRSRLLEAEGFCFVFFCGA